MSHLVIVESPSKSKTIQKYLGSDYTVVSSKGHVRDLAIKGKGGLGVDVEHDFKPTYEISKDKKETVKELKALAKQCDDVYLATDPDREGEAISWHLADELGLNIQDKNRIEFHEVTEHAVKAALNHPRTIDMDLVKSQETRRILDRIIGFRLSKLLNTKIKSKSAGRVQSVALKLIVDREKEINAFVPEEYWDIKAQFFKDDIDFEAELSTFENTKIELKCQTDCETVLNALKETFDVKSVDVSERKRAPRLAYITSTLQQDAANKLRFSAKRTMSIAQRLYEGVDLGGNVTGLITYMRTDSSRLAPEFVDSANAYIESTYGKEYLGAYHARKDKNAQDAHEAIRPTSVANTPQKVKPYLQSDEFKLYQLIYIRTIASLMAPAVYDTVSVMLDNNGYGFTTSGYRLKFDGYLKLAAEIETVNDKLLPMLNQNESIMAQQVIPTQHFTEPPLRYSEARLIKKLEEEGIGRPSTYATIIDTIQQRGYVELKPASEGGKTKVFFPSEQGMITTEALDAYFNQIINVKYTANMESELDEIAEGKLDNVAALHRFYDEFEPLVDNAYKTMEKKQPEKVGRTCPTCGGELVYRVGRYGKFISCSNYPECTYVERIQDPNAYVPTPTGKFCPKCGGELLRRKSRFGTFFLGCSNYPKCHYMETEDGEEIVPKSRRGKTSSTKQGAKDSQKKSTAVKSTSRKTSAKKTAATKKKATQTSTGRKSTRKRTTRKAMGVRRSRSAESNA